MARAATTISSAATATTPSSVLLETISLDGRAGRDKLLGGEGDDVLIGGLDQDDLNGGVGTDLLLGGRTVYDGQTKVTLRLLSEWSVPNTYATRIERMESELFAARLESEETVFDDGVLDALYGDGGQDWFFITGAMPILPARRLSNLSFMMTMLTTIIIHPRPRCPATTTTTERWTTRIVSSGGPILARA